MDYQEIKPFVRQWLFLLGGTILWYLYQSIYNRNTAFYVMVFVGLLVLAVLLAVLFNNPKKAVILNLNISHKVLIPIIALVTVVASILFFMLPCAMLAYSALRMALAVVLAGLGALLLTASGSKQDVYLNFAVILLAFGVLYRSLSFINEIQNSPFSLGWSEGSRYYNASLFASPKVYGEKLPWPVLHPSRYLMQAVPFWFGIKSIVAHRVWQVLLWLGMTLCTAGVLARRVKDGLKLPTVLVMLYFFLFFFQGAVYYHMMVCVLLVLYGYKKDKPWLTLIFVLAASVWAGISRVNWMPLPALLAVMLYLIEMPFDSKNWLKYLRFPMLWSVLGILISWMSKKAYILLSGEPAYIFDSAFSSALLWERLLPNKTFFIGILPGIILLCLPLLVLVFQKMRGQWRNVHWLRWLGMAGIMFAFLAGGIVVSVKIGGGGDLHNLDAFIFLFAVFASYILAGHLRFETEGNAIPNEQNKTPVWQAKPFWLAVAVIVPVFFAFMRAGTWSFAVDEIDKEELSALRTALQSEKIADGPVLFISERQLLTFDELNDIAIVHPYEKVFLMEMAMSDNQAYLQKFYEQLENHDFAAIVTDPVSTKIQDRTRAFNEENNTWVTRVVIPLLEHYEVVRSFKGEEINLLVPKP